MTVLVQLLSAFIRKADIAVHYPGGCETFEQQHTLGEGDAYLYRLVSMSNEGLGALLDELEQSGLDIEQFVAIADMWAGPFKKTPSTCFTQIGHDFPPTWVAASPRMFCLPIQRKKNQTTRQQIKISSLIRNAR